MTDPAVLGPGFLIIMIALYFLPTIIAKSRHHKNASAIGVTNLLLGWTVIGWIISMIWAHTN